MRLLYSQKVDMTCIQYIYHIASYVLVLDQSSLALIYAESHCGCNESSCGHNTARSPPLKLHIFWSKDVRANISEILMFDDICIYLS